MQENKIILKKLRFKNDNKNKSYNKIHKHFNNERKYFFKHSEMQKIKEDNNNDINYEAKEYNTKNNKDRLLQKKTERKKDEEDDYYTPTEKLFYEKRDIILQKRLEKLAETSYKEKYQKYNKALTKLPQHNDIPKIGPG